MSLLVSRKTIFRADAAVMNSGVMILLLLPALVGVGETIGQLALKMSYP